MLSGTCYHHAFLHVLLIMCLCVTFLTHLFLSVHLLTLCPFPEEPSLWLHCFLTQLLQIIKAAWNLNCCYFAQSCKDSDKIRSNSDVHCESNCISKLTLGLFSFRFCGTVKRPSDFLVPKKKAQVNLEQWIWGMCLLNRNVMVKSHKAIWGKQLKEKAQEDTLVNIK